MKTKHSEVNEMNIFFEKKTKIAFMLSILVYWIHISSFANYTFNKGLAISSINNLFSNFFCVNITEVAVPAFFIISGMLFFRNYSNKEYGIKLTSRFKSLVIPYLIWNTVWMIFDIILSNTFLSNFFTGREKFVVNITNIFLGVFFYKSTPFWFIFNLIIFVIASPLISAN